MKIVVFFFSIFWTQLCHASDSEYIDLSSSKKSQKFVLELFNKFPQKSISLARVSISPDHTSFIECSNLTLTFSSDPKTAKLDIEEVILHNPNKGCVGLIDNFEIAVLNQDFQEVLEFGTLNFLADQIGKKATLKNLNVWNIGSEIHENFSLQKISARYNHQSKEFTSILFGSSSKTLAISELELFKKIIQALFPSKYSKADRNFELEIETLNLYVDSDTPSRITTK